MKLLVLDIDETLLFGTERPLASEPDYVSAPYFFYKRPGVDEFIVRMSTIFELGIWTASTPSYAEVVIPFLFPQNIQPSFVWARDRCTLRYNADYGSHEWVKNLDKLKKRGYPLESIIMVDDTPEKLSKHYGNLVRVHPFEGDSSDRELWQLGNYLEHLSQVPNVRQIEKRGWRSNSSVQTSIPPPP